MMERTYEELLDRPPPETIAQIQPAEGDLDISLTPKRQKKHAELSKLESPDCIKTEAIRF